MTQKAKIGVAGLPISGYQQVGDFVDGIERPRWIVLMLKTGEAVDQFIGQLLPHLEDRDIISNDRRSLSVRGTGLLRRSAYRQSTGQSAPGSARLFRCPHL